ncbi:hypothetical protein APHAL10511_000251 [Amanita phalloides]|nr:hypothetical protein APHAL10511_000251 [Amanita phalloides]
MKTSGPESLVPVHNTFSYHLSKHSFNFFSMFVPDLLHEFELGVWKAIFKHLMRIIHEQGSNSIQTLNKRYRMISPFGRGTIRRFHSNASAMKKLAGRDFEDLLQCAIPVFEGLLDPQYDKIIRELLFELATWHALAKLRLHTETTIRSLEHSTVRLGMAIRHFESDVCSQIKTYSLPPDDGARSRRRRPPKTTDLASAKCKLVTFNMETYKLHALGHYADAIRRFGPSDGFSTQTGEAEHQRVKRHYKRASKCNFTHGIAKQNQRERMLRKIRERQMMREVANDNIESQNPSLPPDDDEPLPFTAPEVHHHMSLDTKHKVNLTVWLRRNRHDVALKNFLQRLKNHLLTRLLGLEYDGDECEYPSDQRNQVIILGGVIYQHKVLRINYTTYDMRRDQDSLNPRTSADFMVLGCENKANTNPHPYWYGRILRIFHVNVIYTGPQSRSSDPQLIELLWVRWLGRDTASEYHKGWKSHLLPKVGFVPHTDDAAFGFVNPMLILRAVHLIPCFELGRTNELLPEPSICRLPIEKDQDWNMFYVNIFVDRDMFMRFRGGGVGHKSFQTAIHKFCDDRWSEELEDSRREEPMNVGKESIQVSDNTVGEFDTNADDAELPREAEDEVESDNLGSDHDSEAAVVGRDAESDIDNFFDPETTMESDDELEYASF